MNANSGMQFDARPLPSTSGIVNRAKLMSVATTLKDAKVGRITRVLWVLLAAVAFVLLVACANAANLFSNLPRLEEVALDSTAVLYSLVGRLKVLRLRR